MGITLDYYPGYPSGFCLHLRMSNQGTTDAGTYVIWLDEQSLKFGQLLVDVLQRVECDQRLGDETGLKVIPQ